MAHYIPTIGLEIHAELKTKSKMFCSCKNDSEERQPNVNICPICMGHPGTLPMPNEEAILLVRKVGLAFNCQITEFSKFDRKHYFYPDLPKGYQISQYDAPLCKNGYLDIPIDQKSQTIQNSQSSKFKKIRIRRVHLEEDTGKLIHPTGTDYSLVDFNRVGVPLMELVTEPDINSAKEASALAKEFQLILRYLGASDADMEKGQMRVEVNISLRANDQDLKQPKLGTKVEIKNLNSFAAVEQAIVYEIQRQSEILNRGEKVVQETRGWNDSTQQTFSQREKEEAHDYRYFPEPDIPPLTITKAQIEMLGAELPELPQARRERFQREYGISPVQTEFFVQNKDLGEYFEKVVSELGPHISRERLQKLIMLSANYITSNLMGLLQAIRGSEESLGSPRGASVEGEDFLITPENFAELMVLIDQDTVSSAVAKQVLKEMFAKGGDPSHIIEEKGLAQVSNEDELASIARQVIEENPKAVEDYKKGKTNALEFLVGKMMAQSRGKANPETSRMLLTSILGKDIWRID